MSLLRIYSEPIGIEDLGIRQFACDNNSLVVIQLRLIGRLGRLPKMGTDRP